MLKKLDTFQIKGIMKIMGWKSTYIERKNTNKELRRAAGKISGERNSKGKRYIRPMSKSIKDTQVKYLGHLLRETHGEPTKRCTFLKNMRPFLPHKLRVGRPREQWTIQVLKRAYM